MPKIKVIVNPTAGHGYGAQASPIIRQILTRLGADFDLVHTTAPGEATLLARQARAEGYEIIVAVGGDGTSHEVVNGLMVPGNGPVAGTLGCIPAGSGNDFAEMNGAPRDLEAACRLIVAGASRLVDLGQVTIDGKITQYFANAVGIGFDGVVTRERLKFKYLRGMALYLPVVLKTIFVTMRPPRIELRYDDETFQQRTLMTVISNGPREGGAFLVAPAARCNDGELDLTVVETMPKLSMLAMVPRFMSGSHIRHRLVKSLRARQVCVTSEDPLYLHVDGELPCEEAHQVEVRVVPACLRMIAPPSHS